MRKLGFTLAEVLITLVIIGVIAAMTVPTLMNNTNAQEYRTGLKKAVSSLNQAVSMEYALDGMTVGDFSSSANIVSDLFKKRLSVIPDDGTSNKWDSVTRTPACAGTTFTTNDGMKFCVNLNNLNAGGVPGDTNTAKCNVFNTVHCGEMWVDVNGEKKPNKQTTTANAPKDVYKLLIYNQRVTPGDAVAQQIMFDKEVK